MIAFVFPGQGSQSIGMGKDLFDAFESARFVFEEVDETLKQKLSQLVFSGDADELMRTENTQPALMAVSMAMVRVLQKELGYHLKEHASFLAGHSLGEYAAHAAANSFSLSDTAKLLRTRGLAMQKAVPVGVGAMAALLGADFDQVIAIAKEAAGSSDVCEVANDNSPGQIVISGHKVAIERAIEIAKNQGIKRAVLLPVSAPFHSSLMLPAQTVMAEALAAVDARATEVPIIANVTVSAVKTPDEYIPCLVDQVTGRVRWRETILFLKSQGVKKVIEIGAGKVLTGLVKRIDPDMDAVSLNTPQDLETFAQSL
ncbi:MAG: ACP S-malonyltransferase [Candidatus Nucleicultricaceae bacterium]